VVVTNGAPDTIAGLHHEMVQEFKHAKDDAAREFQHTNAAIAEVKEKVEETNGSVRQLQIWRAFITGALALLGIIVASGGAWLLVLTQRGT
jgi:hypothetical protein